MPLANKPLNEINEADLQELIDNQVAEGKDYDYKLQLWGNADADKKEFLADVSSFANTVGGHLIVGIEEAGGVPIRIVGLQGDMDAAKLRLDSILLTGIAPRIQGVDMRAVQVQSGNVLIIRIPRSWSAPHMVTFGDSSKFYARVSGRKYQLDVDQIRSAFTLSETATERIRNFRLDRVAKISADDTPIMLEQGAKLVLHVVPIGALVSTTLFDLPRTQRQIALWLTQLYEPVTVNNSRHNLDGLLLYGAAPTDVKAASYIQFFRNGAIEVADTWILRGDDKTIPDIQFEKTLLTLLPLLFSLQKEIGIQPPVIVMLSLLGVGDYKMATDPHLGGAAYYRDNTIDRDDLFIPDILVENFEDSLDKSLKPLFDMVWNSCGWPSSMNYNENGERKPDKRR